MTKRHILNLRPEFVIGMMHMIDWFEITEGAGFFCIRSGLRHADGETKSPYHYEDCVSGKNAEKIALEKFNKWWIIKNSENNRMTTTIRKFRMYGLTCGSLSQIQKAIQFGHAVVEYSLEFGNTVEYKSWAKNDKTFIILNGGSTNINTSGTLNTHGMSLYDNNIAHACFYEPGLGDQLTAVVFLVDDRVWDKETWPDFKPSVEDEDLGNEDIKNSPGYQAWERNFISSSKHEHGREEAEKIVWMRNFLKQFRLA